MSKKKKLMFVGSSAAGKTTLTQYLNNKELVYKKHKRLKSMDMSLIHRVSIWSTGAFGQPC